MGRNVLNVNIVQIATPSRVQLPVALDDLSEPGRTWRSGAGPHASMHTHPARPVLVVEVAQSSVALDRHHKASLYARAGVPEYWIVDIVDDVLEVYRRPGPSPDAVYGSSYADVQRFPRGATVFPLAASTTSVVVTDLML